MTRIPFWRNKSALLPLVVLLGGALALRLLLAPFPGYDADTDLLVAYSKDTGDRGVLAVQNSQGEIDNQLVLYPPVFVYHAFVLGKVTNPTLAGMESKDPAKSIVFRRLCVRLIPIFYDLLLGLLIWLVLARYCPANVAAFGGALYLFNPGAIVNSALWNYDPMVWFFLTLAVTLAAVAFANGNNNLLLMGWAACGLAFCSKLQGGLVLPILGMITLLTRRVGVICKSAAVFVGVVLLMYSPFLLARQWDFLKRIFLVSFDVFPLTHMNSYNLWGLFYQMPVDRRVAGVTLEHIGQGLYFVAMAFLLWQVLRQTSRRISGGEAHRFVAIVATYGCAAPFILLTRMHERYFGAVLGFCLMAGLLDRRMRAAMYGFSVVYAANMLCVLLGYWSPWRAASSDQVLAKSFLTSIIVVRFLCSLLNVALFAWLTTQLPRLLSAPAVTPGQESHRS